MAGSWTVTPGGSTTYTLTADGITGSVTRQVTLTVLADTDGDGLPDDWEIAWGLDPGSSDSDGDSIEDPDEDEDGDGVPNLAEYRGGYDPTDPNSPPAASGSSGISCAAAPSPAPSPAAVAALLWISLLCGVLLRRRWPSEGI